MIITLEADGQPWLDSTSEKKVSLDIVLPEQSYYPQYPVHPVLRNINTGYASSLSTADDSRSVITLTGESEPRRRRWHLFSSPFSFKKKPTMESLLSGSTMVEKPGQRARRVRPPLSWTELSTKWLIGWLLLTLLLCAIVACGVWIAAKRRDKNVWFQNMNSEWSPDAKSIFSIPAERFGCYDEAANTAYNGSQLLMAPPGTAGEHTFIVQGGASGHLTLAGSPDPSATMIAYDLAIQGNTPSLEKVVFDTPRPGPISPPSTNFIISTPTTMIESTGSTDIPPCVRFDVTMYIPRNLKKLTVNVSTPIQITFSPQGHVELDSFSISLTNSHPKIRIDTSPSLQAKSLSVEMYTGIIRGMMSIGDSAQITNWNGQIQLEIIPDAPVDIFSPLKATLMTTTNNGKVDIRYSRNKAYRRRTINSYHTMGTKVTSVGNFDYGCSGFNGLLYSNSSKYNMTNERVWRTGRVVDEFAEDEWQVVLGNRTGKDRVYVRDGTGTIILPDHSWR